MPKVPLIALYAALCALNGYLLGYVAIMVLVGHVPLEETLKRFLLIH